MLKTMRDIHILNVCRVFKQDYYLFSEIEALGGTGGDYQYLWDRHTFKTTSDTFDTTNMLKGSGTDKEYWKLNIK